MKILLVQPRPEEGIGFPNLACVEPLGLEIVAASLKEKHQVEVLDLFRVNEFVNYLLQFAPDAVGISCSFTVDVFRTLLLSQRIKEIMPEAFVFVGGHHASLSPGDFAHASVDAVVIGEGETVVPKLIDTLEIRGDLINVPGLALFDQNRKKQVLTPQLPLESNLDQMPMPDRDVTEKYRKRYFLGFRRPLATVETSRGCPYKCNFCSVWRFYRNTVRYKDPLRVVEEIERVQEKNIMFVDDNFFNNPKRALKIASLLHGKNKRFVIQARSDTIVNHPYLLEAWKDSGLESIFIGFEKIRSSDLEKIDKRNTVLNNEKALEMIREKGMKVYASFIVDPDFEEADFKNLRDYIKKWNIRFPYFSVLTPLPGTKLYHLKKNEITTSNWELYDLLHAVLPTRIPLAKFYHELASLYRLSYTGEINLSYVIFVLGEFFRVLLKDRWSFEHLRKLYRGGKMMVNPKYYLQ